MPSTTTVVFLSHDLVRVWLLPAQEVLMRCNPLRFNRLETHVAYEAEEVTFLGLGLAALVRVSLCLLF
jgi:hypothetical protein